MYFKEWKKNTGIDLESTNGPAGGGEKPNKAKLNLTLLYNVLKYLTDEEEKTTTAQWHSISSWRA